MYTAQELDVCKTKILKYVLYKKRTEKEIRQKFGSAFSEELLDDAIETLKENGYISDTEYIKRAINEFMALNTMSIKEIRYKLYAKGISGNDLEEYIENHLDELEEFEIQSAYRVFQKKSSSMEEFEIQNYLMKKGYTKDRIEEARNRFCAEE